MKKLNEKQRAKVFKILWIVGSFVSGLLASRNPKIGEVVQEVIYVVTTP